MAKVNAPLFGFEARGQIGEALTYSNWRGVKYAKQYTVPANPNTVAQQQTRNLMRFLTSLWRYLPAQGSAAWNAFAAGRPFVGSNAFIGQNIKRMRKPTIATDLTDLLTSPGANGGLPIEAMTPTPAATSIALALVNPSPPTGWTLTAAMAMAIKDQDPQIVFPGPIAFDYETVDPTSLSITGLESATEYHVGAFLIWEKPDGKPAYGISTDDMVTTTS